MIWTNPDSWSASHNCLGSAAVKLKPNWAFIFFFHKSHFSNFICIFSFVHPGYINADFLFIVISSPRNKCSVFELSCSLLNWQLNSCVYYCGTRGHCIISPKRLVDPFWANGRIWFDKFRNIGHGRHISFKWMQVFWMQQKNVYFNTNSEIRIKEDKRFITPTEWRNF